MACGIDDVRSAGITWRNMIPRNQPRVAAADGKNTSTRQQKARQLCLIKAGLTRIAILGVRVNFRQHSRLGFFRSSSTVYYRKGSHNGEKTYGSPDLRRHSAVI